jgi:vancomycin permeability regulator SanA
MEQIPEQQPINWFRRIGIGAAGLMLVSVASVGTVITYVQLSRVNMIGWEKTPVEYALVLGASVKQDGTPSDALYDRVATAVELYNDDYVQKLLMTGDDGKFHANEVAVMKRVAMELGVPESDILVDGHGYRTYESCKRAKEVFDIDEAVIVTQRFHLARALYLCGNFMKISVQGRVADRQSYQRIVFFWARDLASSFKAWWDINIQEPKPPVSESERD